MKIIDMHTSLIQDNDASVYAHMKPGTGRGDPSECSIPATIERLDKNNVESAVVWKIGRNAEECRQNNDFIAQAAADNQDRFIPFATVFPPALDAALAEIDRALLELGLAGVKVHPNVMNFQLDSPEVIAVVEKVAEIGAPFVTHVSATLSHQIPKAARGSAPDLAASYSSNPNSDPSLLKPLALAYDSPRFQSAHMGAVTSEWIASSNISFQTTGASRDVIQWALETIGEDRIVFGSDFPFFLVENEISKILELDATDATKERILSGNALTRVLN